MTSYVAVVGQGTAWPGAGATSFKDFRDGTPNTLLVAEIADSGIHWMEPRDLDADAMPFCVNPAKGPGISSHHRDVGWSQRLLGAHVGIADGSVRFLPTDTRQEMLRALLSISGGEKIDRDNVKD